MKHIRPPQEITPEESQKFEAGVVNIEENEDRQPIPYVLPPGIRTRADFREQQLFNSKMNNQYSYQC